MKMKKTGLLLAGLVLSLFTALPVMAGGRGASQGGSDTSKAVHLVGYLLGAEPVGMGEVMKTLNEKLKKDINTTMEIRYIGWGDLASKYPLVLASGDLDWIYTAPWAYYAQEAQKNAFYELNEDMIKTYMPRHYAALDRAFYKQAQVDINGQKKVFMIGTSSPDRKAPAVLIRKDLREKYNIPPIKRFADIEPYLAAIKANEPGMTPMMLDDTYDIKRPFGDLMRERGMSGEDMYVITGGGLNIMYDWRNTSGEIFTFFEEPYRAAAIEVCKIIKGWYDKGYINSDAFGNKVRSKESFGQGKSGVAFGNSVDLQSNIATVMENGWEAEIFPTVLPDGKYFRDAYTNNGIALAAATRNPERVLMAMDLIMQDPAYVMLTYFGIEGKNYAIQPDGKVGLPPGVTSETNTYPIDASGFWFVSKDIMPPLASWTESYIAHRKDLEKILINNPMNGFITNKTPTKTEEANCLNAFMQYGQPLFVGAVKDVNAAFAEMEQKVKAAAYDKIVEEAKRQIAAFVAGLK